MSGLALEAEGDARPGVVEVTQVLDVEAVIACGIAAIAGKLSWDWAIKIIIGIVLIFGAAAIVDYIISAVG